MGTFTTTQMLEMANRLTREWVSARAEEALDSGCGWTPEKLAAKQEGWADAHREALGMEERLEAARMKRERRALKRG